MYATKSWLWIFRGAGKQIYSFLHVETRLRCCTKLKMYSHNWNRFAAQLQQRTGNMQMHIVFCYMGGWTCADPHCLHLQCQPATSSTVHAANIGQLELERHTKSGLFAADVCFLSNSPTRKRVENVRAAGARVTLLFWHVLCRNGLFEIISMPLSCAKLSQRGLQHPSWRKRKLTSHSI